MKDRRIAARQFRIEAAEVAYNRPHPPQRSNGEESRYRIAVAGKNYPSYIGAFTKGFQHDANGFMAFPDKGYYSDFIRACDAGDIASIQALKLNERVTAGQVTTDKPLNDWLSPVAQQANGGAGANVRGWESMGAGLVFDLEGPDAQALAIPPAPTLDSDELTAEVLELYWMALCRDIPFVEFDSNSNLLNKAKIDDAIEDLNALPWFDKKNLYGLHAYELARKRGYFKNTSDNKAFTHKDIFRGNVKGDNIGPYISQFLCAGNVALGPNPPLFGPETGRIQYGSMTAEQKVRIATPGHDYMTDWNHWLDVQNGADLRHLETYAGTTPADGYRFICTPRDLCTYVHYDALHQAYFNACLLLLGIGAPFDPDLPFQLPDSIDKQTGFAQFGPPHILNLVSEVATRALKAVRFQKYNVHRRVRPEVVAAWIHRYATNHKAGLDVMKKSFDVLKTKKVWKTLEDYNAGQNGLVTTDPGYAGKESYLLPMPFVEGSPMHPSYGSGHATVAGACVTVLKAFFDEGFVMPFAYQADATGNSLTDLGPAVAATLTVENELNKLAGNIAFGRNWAGVHYWSDQAESLRLGEQIALGILEEQKLQYGENFSMTVPLLDGTSVRI